MPTPSRSVDVEEEPRGVPDDQGGGGGGHGTRGGQRAHIRRDRRGEQSDAESACVSAGCQARPLEAFLQTSRAVTLKEEPGANSRKQKACGPGPRAGVQKCHTNVTRKPLSRRSLIVAVQLMEPGSRGCPCGSRARACRHRSPAPSLPSAGSTQACGDLLLTVSEGGCRVGGRQSQPGSRSAHCALPASNLFYWELH